VKKNICVIFVKLNIQKTTKADTKRADAAGNNNENIIIFFYCSVVGGGWFVFNNKFINE
tara:strand:- start:4028 stop:4204 length:177 start_codon:yes stop_codon:yes gene_type:complete